MNESTAIVEHITDLTSRVKLRSEPFLGRLFQGPRHQVVVHWVFMALQVLSHYTISSGLCLFAQSITFHRTNS
eukprot:3262349-Amphidinium_carterae.1